MNKLDQSEEEALVASSVKFCGFFFKFKAGGHLPFESQTLRNNRRPVRFRHADACRVDKQELVQLGRIIPWKET